ncbi:MAG: VOC family protein [Cyanobacteria bacterium P01_D01_bin.50]
MNTSNSLRNIKADHIAIRVTNFEETLNWYKEKLGFQEEVFWTVEGLRGMKLAYLTLNGFRIEIIGGGDFQPTHKPPKDFQEALNIQGYGHICFEVEDIDGHP